MFDLVIAAALMMQAGASQRDSVAVQRERVEAAYAEYKAAARAVERADSIEKARRLHADVGPLDSMIAAPFIIVTRGPEAQQTFRAFRNAIAKRRTQVAGLEAFPPITLLVQVDSQYPRFQLMGRAARHHLVMLHSRARENYGNLALVALDNALLDYAPQPLRVWLGDSRYTGGRERETVSRALATARSGVAKRCVSGDTSACVTGFELTTNPDSMRGYTRAEIRAIAARTPGVNRRIYSDCVDLGDTSQCLRYLAPRGGPPMPIPQIARASLLAFAIDRGGDGSVARLSRGASVEAALTAAANMDASMLIGEWQASVLAQRPAAAAGTGARGLVTLAWAGLFLAFALRSTRRRFG